MKKVISLALAVITVFSVMTMGVSALSIGIEESEAKGKAASYVGTTVDNLKDYSCTPVDTTVASLLVLSVKYKDYNMTFKANNTKYTVTIDALGSLKNYSYEGNGVKKPVDYSCKTENDCLAAAFDKAGVSSGDAYVYSNTFSISNYEATYNFSFYGKDCDCTAKVNALTGKVIDNGLAKTEKNVVIVFFLKLFARIKNAFGF